MKWQPIETAPKDGTNILLFAEYGDAPFVGWYSPRQQCWFADREHYTVDCGPYCQGGSVCLQRDTKPTHWMTLPPKPIDGTQADEPAALESSANNEVVNK